jgi:hypothetical protein
MIATVSNEAAELRVYPFAGSFSGVYKNGCGHSTRTG